MKKRILSFLLALAMILPLIPATQIAANAESTDVVVVPKVNGTQSVDLSQVNSALEFAEGTTNAYCYACGKVATWVSLDDYDPADYWKDETATTAWLFGEHHYYVPETEGDYTFGEVTPVRLNFMEIGLNSSVCLHLNGQNLVTAGNAHNGGGTFSLMGEGSWVSTYIDEKTHESDTKDERLGSVVNNYASGAVSNLFGGELSSGETGGVYVISFGAAGTTAEGTINIYRDVTVNGNIFTRGATINVNGATINGRVYMMDHNADKVCGTFNMVGGVWNGVASIPLAKPVDGEVGYGGAIYAEAGAVVNLTDVEINGAHVAGNGGAICTKDATVNIKGCTIRGGQSDAIKAGATSEEMYGGGNIYVASTALTIEDTEISDGIAAANGGNILAYGNCAVTLKTGTVIYNGRSTKTGTVNTTVDNKGFTYNGGGGNVYVHGAASTLVVEEGTQIYGGSANYKGKDIATADGAKVTIAGTVGSADKAGATTVLYVQKTNPIADLLEVTGGTIYGQIETVRGNVKFNGGTMICSHATSIVNKQSATITANHGSFSYNPSGYLGENTTLVTVGEMHNVHKNVTLAQATDATCREPGKIDHYTCALCDLTFADAECTQQISAIDSTKPAHTQTAVAEQPAECTAKGVKAYWECNDCEKLWADEACTQEIKDLEAWKNDPQGGQIPEAEHAYAYEFKDAEAHTVRCTTCGEVFADGPHNTLSAACELCGRT